MLIVQEGEMREKAPHSMFIEKPFRMERLFYLAWFNREVYI
jgi:hypothetical protein